METQIFFAKFGAKQGKLPRPDAIGVSFCPAPNVIEFTFCPVFCNRGDVFRPDYARGQALMVAFRYVR